MSRETMNNPLKKTLPLLTMAAVMGAFGDMPSAANPFGARGPAPRAHDPWEDEHIPKQVRRGKTYEEIQALRKVQWENKHKK